MANPEWDNYKEGAAREAAKAAIRGHKEEMRKVTGAKEGLKIPSYNEAIKTLQEQGIKEVFSGGEGIKHDSSKLRLDLLPVDVLEGVARILTHGAKKYGDRNWEGGISYSRLYGATLRHLFAAWRGEDIDPESGLPHIDHALCELVFLSAMMKRRKDLDDRPEGGKI